MNFSNSGKATIRVPLPKRGFPPTVPFVEIVNAILYKLKTGVQWHQLPTQVFF
ncbi:hypothetical protein CSW08_09060 [Confluentibacter flavum]|uniref:Transposase n=1 Tax=Confluentibacter flavum TaxID=1909700 RepID=A0A2N3HJV1_9FLAO|nr:hypothetical protein CSW08_09060 [Confluentibacter flavum]